MVKPAFSLGPTYLAQTLAGITREHDRRLVHASATPNAGKSQGLEHRRLPVWPRACTQGVMGLLGTP